MGLNAAFVNIAITKVYKAEVVLWCKDGIACLAAEDDDVAVVVVDEDGGENLDAEDIISSKEKLFG